MRHPPISLTITPNGRFFRIASQKIAGALERLIERRWFFDKQNEGRSKRFEKQGFVTVRERQLVILQPLLRRF